MTTFERFRRRLTRPRKPFFIDLDQVPVEQIYRSHWLLGCSWIWIGWSMTSMAVSAILLHGELGAGMVGVLIGFPILVYGLLALLMRRRVVFYEEHLVVSDTNPAGRSEWALQYTDFEGVAARYRVSKSRGSRIAYVGAIDLICGGINDITVGQVVGSSQREAEILAETAIRRVAERFGVPPIPFRNI